MREHRSGNEILPGGCVLAWTGSLAAKSGDVPGDVAYGEGG